MYIEELYVELLKEGRVDKIELSTSPFSFFNLNLSGALLLPTLKYGPESDDDMGEMNMLILQELAIALIITSFETYYRDIFTTITENIKTSEIEPAVLSRFLKKARLTTEFVQTMESENSLNFKLSKFIPDFFPLQQKEKLKIAMKLIGLNPSNRNKEWTATFGVHDGSTIKQRHSFIHSGVYPHKLSKILNFFSDTKNRIKDAIVLVYSLETQIHKQYPSERINELYPQKITKGGPSH
jgi:hypothetical protein